MINTNFNLLGNDVNPTFESQVITLECDRQIRAIPSILMKKLNYFSLNRENLHQFTIDNLDSSIAEKLTSQINTERTAFIILSNPEARKKDSIVHSFSYLNTQEQETLHNDELDQLFKDITLFVKSSSPFILINDDITFKMDEEIIDMKKHFYENLSGADAEKLMQDADVGSYLLRTSNPLNDGDENISYILSFKMSDTEVLHLSLIDEHPYTDHQIADCLKLCELQCGIDSGTFLVNGQKGKSARK